MRYQRNLPRDLKVGPLDYTIEPFDREVADARKLFGEHQPTSQRILIDLQHGYQRAATSLLHELIHAVWHVWGIEDTQNEREERVVVSLTYGLSTLWRDNPEVFRWIEKGLR